MASVSTELFTDPFYRGVDRIDIVDGIQGGVIGTIDSWGTHRKMISLTRSNY